MQQAFRFSMIICTYNPSPRLFQRVLSSCLEQLSTHSSAELLIIDNNSSPPLDLPEVRQAISSEQRVYIYREEKQGLVYARLKGLKESKGEILVFVDDDNVLANDYLQQLEILIRAHPGVAVWGPGIVVPEYLSAAPRWISKYFGGMYQQRNSEEVCFGSEAGWPAYYPTGSGMAVSRAVMETYAAAIQKQTLSAMGRKGESLASGEDAQIVWTAVKMQREVGTAPSLVLRHLIPEKRLNLSYLRKLQYELGYAYCKGIGEFFPAKLSELRPLHSGGKLRVIIRLLEKSKFKPLLFWRMFVIEKAWYRGAEKAWANRK